MRVCAYIMGIYVLVLHVLLQAVHDSMSSPVQWLVELQ